MKQERQSQKMELKRFKQIRESGKIIKSYVSGENNIEVKETFNAITISLNAEIVETFKTKEMALLVAEQTYNALGQKQ